MHTMTSPETTTGSSPEGWRLERLEHGRLDLVDAVGRRHHDVDVLRAFPVTAPTGPVAIIAADGGELAWVESLAEQPAELRRLLERELAQREFLPVFPALVRFSPVLRPFLRDAPVADVSFDVR
jgi:hypothetical protein